MSGRASRAASTWSTILVADDDRDEEENDELYILPEQTIISTLDAFQVQRMEFENEMDLSISGVINEAIHLFGMDPREYHPFYLRVYKHITIGEKKGLITSKRDGDFYWEKYDNLCAARMSEMGKGFDLVIEKSPYATFIETGNVIIHGKQVSVIRNEKEIDKVVGALEVRAKSIVEGELKRRKVESIDILNDLKMRLAFFEICKVMTFPADCVKMNKLWHNFVNNFSPNPLTKVEPVEVVTIEDDEMDDDFFVPLDFQEDSFSFLEENVPKLPALTPTDAIRQRKNANRKLLKKIAGSGLQKAVEKRKNGERARAKNVVKSALNKNSFKKIEEKKVKLELEICAGPPSKLKRRRYKKSTTESNLKVLNASDISIGRGPFMCEECGLSFSLYQGVLRHKLTQHERAPELNKCPICNLQLTNPKELGLHFLRKHTLECGHAGLLPIKSQSTAEGYPKPCPHCPDVIVESYPDYHNHMRRAHRSQEKFLCPHCPNQYKTKDWLTAHIKEVHQGITHRCDICRRNLQSAGKLWKHKVDSHGLHDLPPPAGVNVEMCEICGEKLMRGMLQHIKKHHPEHAVAYAEILKARAKEKKEMMKGQWRKYEERKRVRERRPEKRRYSCHMINCTQTFVKRYRWERHIQAHMQHSFRVMERVGLLEQVGGDAVVPQWKCLLCEEELRGNEALTIHLVSKHRQTLDRLPEEDVIKITLEGKLDCTHNCPYQFDTHEELRNHLEIFHPSTSYRCPECSVIVITPDDLQEHFLLEHSDPSPLSLWGKAKAEYAEDARKRNWRRRVTPKKKNESYNPHHKKIIPDVPNPLSCLHCPGHFKDRNELAVHIKAEHPQEKVYSCGSCENIRFTERAMLHHIATCKTKPSHGAWQNPLLSQLFIRCEICDESVQARSFLRHVKTKHGIVEGGRGPQCPCGRTYTTRIPWIVHMEEVHSGDVKQLLIIASQINQMEEVDGEIKMPKAMENMQCLYCPEKGATRVELAKHVREAHPSQTIWECPYCPERSKVPRFTKRALHYHVTCGPCNKKALKDSRKWINPCQGPLMELTCKICELEVNFQNYLDHMKTKHGLIPPGPFQCPCNETFEKAEWWLVHMEELHKAEIPNLLEFARNMMMVEVENKRKKRPASLRQSKGRGKRRKRKELSESDDEWPKRSRRGVKRKATVSKPRRNAKRKCTKGFEDYKAEFNLKQCWVRLKRL